MAVLRGPDQIKRVIVLAWAIGSLAALVIALANLQIDRSPSATAGEQNLRALWPFWIAAASGWASLTALWMLLRRAPSQGWGRNAHGAIVILAVALTARGAVVVTHEPSLSDDIYRYLFDGRNTAAGRNPYLQTPQEAADEPGSSALGPLVNNPELYTIYLPTSQWVFAGVALGGGSGEPARAERVYRAVFVLFELAAIGGLLLALRRAGRSPWWVTLYAWHPLPITEIAGTGHQDAVGLALLMAAILVGESKQGRRVLGTALWTSLLALATLVKPVVLPVAAFLLKGRPWWSWAGSISVGALVCLVVAAPLWLSHDLEPLRNLLATANRFTLKWAHFGSVYEPLLTTIERLAPGWTNDQQEVLARRICAALVAVIIVWAWARAGRGGLWAGARTIFLAMVLLSPAAHPWYLLWALAMVPVAPSPTVWIATLTLPFGYAVLGDVVEWSLPVWVMVAAYAPVYGALLVDTAKRLKNRKSKAES